MPEPKDSQASSDARPPLSKEERRFAPTLSSDETYAIRDFYAQARAAGYTYAGTPSGWIAEWLVHAARIVGRGRRLEVRDPRYTKAMALLLERKGFSDEAEAVFQSVLACSRMLEEQIDPFEAVSPEARPEPRPSRRGR